MKIYSMAATFGKLEHQLLELKPGLNIIEAPNEWGKSTWCAFIVAMLYGIDTGERKSKNNIPDKERYAPWSGAPMEGRMDICWKGRDITIERRTKGRLIFGEFRAYETQTGLDIPELTAANCGMELLGVERSVFLRAGFLKMSDMPVTQDDALRRRLNNLVTTGDENNDGEKLAQALKDLKNRCRYNRTGLLPQAEAERDRLEDQLSDLRELNMQSERLQMRQQELDGWIDQLKNHKTALEYTAAQEKHQHIRDAELIRDRIAQELQEMETECAAIPTAGDAERTRSELQRVYNESMSLQMEQQMLPAAPAAPACPDAFAGLSGEQAVEQAKLDIAKVQQLQKNQKVLSAAAIFAGVAAIALGLLGAFVLSQVSGILYTMAAGMLLMSVGAFAKSQLMRRPCNARSEKYGTDNRDEWLQKAEEFKKQRQAFDEENSRYQQAASQLQERREELMQRLQALTDGEPVEVRLNKLEQVVQQWKTLGDLRRDLQRANSQLEALQAVSQDVPAPSAPDKLHQTMSETDTLLANAIFEQKQNQHRLGQFQGQAEALGQENTIRNQLKRVKVRIEQLEETYAALEVAQKALSSATSELQRRFAPRIAKRSQELFGLLTGGRYDKVVLAEDLSIHVSAENETTTRPSQLRSEGTVDQLYLALRLAVAEELTPNAPLVLDDAMVRFDDTRAQTALNILSQMAETKQVILFTCQGREKKLQGEL